MNGMKIFVNIDWTHKNWTELDNGLFKDFRSTVAEPYVM